MVTAVSYWAPRPTEQGLGSLAGSWCNRWSLHELGQVPLPPVTNRTDNLLGDCQVTEKKLPCKQYSAVQIAWVAARSRESNGTCDTGWHC